MVLGICGGVGCGVNDGAGGVFLFCFFGGCVGDGGVGGVCVLLWAGVGDGEVLLLGAVLGGDSVELWVVLLPLTLETQAVFLLCGGASSILLSRLSTFAAEGGGEVGVLSFFFFFFSSNFFLYIKEGLL
jgi:hypothetical protein